MVTYNDTDWKHIIVAQVVPHNPYTSQCTGEHVDKMEWLSSVHPSHNLKHALCEHIQ